MVVVGRGGRGDRGGGVVLVWYWELQRYMLYGMSCRSRSTHSWICTCVPCEASWCVQVCTTWTFIHTCTTCIRWYHRWYCMYVYMFNVMYLFKMYYVHTSQLTLLNIHAHTHTHTFMCDVWHMCAHTCRSRRMWSFMYVACSKDYFYFKLRVNV